MLQSFNWPKPVRYVLTHKRNGSICIRIRRILKVKIPIWRMRIFTSFVTSHHITSHHIRYRPGIKV